MRVQTLLVLSILFAGGAVRGAEISTNGTGGGPWSDPATWRGKAAPGPADDVVIRKYDVVTFDRPDDGKPTCGKLQIDPRGGLIFKSGAGKLALVVRGGIESFGPIRLDGRRSADDEMAIRLMGEAPESRQIKLGKGGALVLLGRAGLPGGRCNVVLASPESAPLKEDRTGLVDVEGPALLDWQCVRVDNVKLVAKKIDNTGTGTRERLRVSDCRFTGQGRIYCQNCDSPEIWRNTLTYAGQAVIQDSAIHLHLCPLPEVKDNAVRGKFLVGLGVYACSDPVLTGNTLVGCSIGVAGGYGVPNTMLKKTVIRGCETGLRMEGATGVIEEALVEGASTAFAHQNSNLQVNDLRIKSLDKKGLAVAHDGGPLVLQGCNVLPGQVKIALRAPEPGKAPIAPVTCQLYAVLKIKDAPAGSVIEVRTAGLAGGAADPNVRNSPAPLAAGSTPPAGHLAALVVKAWSLDPAGKLQPGPEYAVKVLGPPASAGAARAVLRTFTFRPRVDEAGPALEVPLQ